MGVTLADIKAQEEKLKKRAGKTSPTEKAID